jgi:16S rRNA G966 N2-methylase RsmD
MESVWFYATLRHRYAFFLKKRGSLIDMIPLPDKKYNIVYADPPWNIGGYVKETKKGMNDYRLPYETMTVAIANIVL